MNKNWINVDWPVPANIFAVSTMRMGGVSQLPFDSFNLATHVDDALSNVLANRAYLIKALSLPGEPSWLEQTHSNRVVCLDAPIPTLQADASYTSKPGKVCAILTADCLPVLICNEAGSKVAAIHAGWRGLLSGVIENTVHALQDKDLLVWLGPAIGRERFEVGQEVRDAYCRKSELFSAAFTTKGNNKWLADIYALCRVILAQLGIIKVYGGGFCTVTDQERFFSYRRTSKTGRMATLIWRT